MPSATTKEDLLPGHIVSHIDALWTRFAREEHVPGMIAGIVRGDRLIHLWTYGVADIGESRVPNERSVFRIASMTKSFTALAVLLLRDEGLLRLDEPAEVYVPELAQTKRPTTDSPLVTVRDLLVHNAGFVNDDAWADRYLGIRREEFTRFIADGLPISRPSRTGFEYANLGYALLGRVVANVTGQRFQEFVSQRLFKPLAMRSTTFDPTSLSRAERAAPYRWNGEAWLEEPLEPDGEFGAIGGIATTAADYARYLSFLLGAWPARDDPDYGPVRRSTVRELALGHGFPLAPDPQHGPAASSVYGNGMISAHNGTIGLHLHHTGGLPGYGSHMLVLPNADLALFTFTNRTYAQPIFVNKEVARLLIQGGCARKIEVVPSEPLRRAVAAVEESCRTESPVAIAAVSDPVLMLDKPVGERDAELRKLRAEAGEIRSSSIHWIHSHSAELEITCERGKLRAVLLLAPTPTAGIQKLELQFQASEDQIALERLRKGCASAWLRPRSQMPADLTPLLLEELAEAEARFDRFRPALARLFPDGDWNGRIESPLLPYVGSEDPPLLVKADHALPMTGSVKARGGVYEVLCRVDELLSSKGLSVQSLENFTAEDFRDALAGESITVASTGNLGISIGLVARAFGLTAKVHMSRDAKEWKKARLREVGAAVFEHDCDYAETVAGARETAAREGSYFVDDEDSRRLFVGYAVAAKELSRQLEERGLKVSAAHPLVVYLPCGVGGAPGGISAGLKQLYGDNVVCVFVEPVASACVFAALATGGSPVSVYDFGLDNQTVADGLAVPKASRLVLDSVGKQIDAAVAVTDDEMTGWVGRTWREAGLKLEPSAAAAFAAVQPFLNAAAHAEPPIALDQAIHVVWATGGSMLPEAEFQALLQRVTEGVEC